MKYIWEETALFYEQKQINGSSLFYCMGKFWSGHLILKNIWMDQSVKPFHKLAGQSLLLNEI